MNTVHRSAGKADNGKWAVAPHQFGPTSAKNMSFRAILAEIFYLSLFDMFDVDLDVLHFIAVHNVKFEVTSDDAHGRVVPSQGEEKSKKHV